MFFRDVLPYLSQRLLLFYCVLYSKWSQIYIGQPLLDVVKLERKKSWMLFEIISTKHLRLPEMLSNWIRLLFYSLCEPGIWSIPIWANPFPISTPAEAAFAAWSELGMPGICGACGNCGCDEIGLNTKTISTNTKANNLKIWKFMLVVEMLFTLL